MRSCIAVLAALLTLSGAGHAQETSTEKPIAVLLAAGDISKCGSKGRDEASADILLAEVDKAREAGTELFILALGDLAYDNGTKADFECFARSWGREELYPRLRPVPGNHEYSKYKDAKPYFEFFSNLTYVHENRERGGYYAFDVGGGAVAEWRIYAINSYAGVDASAAQTRWLMEDLEASDTPCVLAFWHPFLFSSGHHGHRRSDDPKAPVARGAMMLDMFKLLHQNGASLVLSAHEHAFEQFGRHDVDGRTQADGVRSFVVGTGGAPLYRNVRYLNRAPSSEFYNQDTHGVLRIELYSKRYEWSFVSIAGSSPLLLEPRADSCNAR
ncbi:MAG TPA: metallophosphoesterase [Mesorhizobium sp.]|jgi:hypothetical protein|nr:metallophosphoesterase [Mesorhizobium sp.]